MADPSRIMNSGSMNERQFVGTGHATGNNAANLTEGVFVGTSSYWQ